MKEKPQFSIQARLCKVFWRALLECQMGTALKIFGQKRLRIIILPSRRFRSLHICMIELCMMIKDFSPILFFSIELAELADFPSDLSIKNDCRCPRFDRSIVMFPFENFLRGIVYACSSCRKELVQKFQTQFGLLALGNYFGIYGVYVFFSRNRVILYIYVYNERQISM